MFMGICVPLLFGKPSCSHSALCIVWQTAGKGSVWDYLEADAEINDT